jgi:hypothetical protein
MPDLVPIDPHNFQAAACAAVLTMSEVFREGELLDQAAMTYDCY